MNFHLSTVYSLRYAFVHLFSYNTSSHKGDCAVLSFNKTHVSMLVFHLF